jgi:hypothetical protein
MNNESHHEFDVLGELAALSDDKLRQAYPQVRVGLLEQLFELLGDQELKRTVVSEASFVTLVRRLRALYESGSRALGQAILEAGQLADEGRAREARETLKAFIAANPSKFYREIAQRYMQRFQ